MTTTALELGVLDQSPIAAGEDATDAVAHTIALAKVADALGYHRYWVAEHHASATLACSSPEILITRLAAETRRIRVGSGGVMLAHYSPFKVAENFRLLEVMYPGRIDLGIGRAPGSDGLTAAALAYGSQIGIEYYPAKVRDLVAFVSGKKPLTDAFARLEATPKAANVPDVWLLGSSFDSATYAAEFGLAFSFAHFITPEHAADVCKYYRRHFRPNHDTKARTSVGVFAICSDDPERVRLYRRARELARIRRDRNERGPFPTLEEAASYPFTEAELEAMQNRRSRQLIGSPAEVKEEIELVAAACEADEVIVLTITPEFADRVRSYELIADAFGLATRNL
jgi:luciferase family oxidoreductase group 1